ncbi:MAG: S8 family serine peptidase [Cyclobacteriaceae bacterium]
MAKKVSKTEHSDPLRVSDRELVVIAKKEAKLRASPHGIASNTDADVSGLDKLLKDRQLTFKPIFGESEDSLLREAHHRAPDMDESQFYLDLCYQVEAPEDQLDELAEQLLEFEVVDGAYVKPAAELPFAPDDKEADTLVSEIIRDIPAIPPNFTSRQTYLNAAPEGIDAYYAWTQAGGRGAGIRIIDCEWGWRFNHMDLRAIQGGVIAGGNSSVLNFENHGTAVLGVYSGDLNSYGITGIASDAWAAASSFTGQSVAQAIMNASHRLNAGDIMLLEIHAAGPRYNFQGRADQKGYIAIEWWPDVYLAIRDAVNRGIIVVEAAGNGGENLDDPIYDNRPNGFPSWWRNPFRRNPLDSGAILVGAGAPPPGTHGRNHGPDRSRLDFSNYGALLDAQGYGREVTTTSRGDLWRDHDDPNNRDRWYTDVFSGTSSASPIVVGAVACVQGILKNRGRILLSPARVRELLRITGSPQQDATGRPTTQRIGNRPNLRQLIPRALETRSWTGVQFRGSVGARRTQCWFTFRWPAHWHVLWTVIPTSPYSGQPQIKYKIQVERASDQYITYWICVTNLSSASVNIEGRFAVLGW